MSTAFGKKALGAGARLSEGDRVQRSRSRGERTREGLCVGKRLVIRHVGPLLGCCQWPGLGAGDGCHKVTAGELVFLLKGNLQGPRRTGLPPGRGTPVLVRKRPSRSQAAERQEVCVWAPDVYSYSLGNQLPSARRPRGLWEAAVPAAVAGRPGLEGSSAWVTQAWAAPCPGSPDRVP